VIAFLSFFLSYSDIFYRLTVGVVGNSLSLSLSLSLSHTHTHCTTPLDERAARRRDRYLTTQNIHHKQASMPPAGLEPAIPASQRPQTHRTATGIGLKCFSRPKLYVLPSFCRPINAISYSYTDLPHSYSFRLYYVRLRSASVLILLQRFANDDKHTTGGKRIVASWRTKTFKNCCSR
jgi:hypothetical protein